MKRILLIICCAVLLWAVPASAMICLDNTDTLEGGASVANVVDYTVHGLEGSTFTNLAQGQLSDTDPSVLYTAGAGISIVSVVFVNTHTAAVTVNLYLDPANIGTPRRMVPKNLSLGAGYSMVFDGQRCSVLDDNGGVLSSFSGTLPIANGGTGQVTASAAFGALKQAATTSTSGVSELSTAAEVQAGTDTARVVTPDGLTAAVREQSWAQSDGFYVGTDQVRARDGDGLKLYDDDGNGIFVKDGGNVGIGTASPDQALDVSGEIRASTGILFGTDTAAANTLDDYEEGTYTATLTCGTSGSITLGATTDALAYTKIGRKVTITGRITVASVSSPVGRLSINLPFNLGVLTEHSEMIGSAVRYASINALNEAGTLMVYSSGGSTAAIDELTTTSILQTVSDKMKAASSLTFSFSYFTS